MYIVVVPVLGIFFGKKVSGKVWCGVGIAVAGLYLLCMTESGFSVSERRFSVDALRTGIFLTHFSH